MMILQAIVLLITVSLSGKYYSNAQPSGTTSQPAEMTMCETAYKTTYDCPEKELVYSACGLRCGGKLKDLCHERYQPCYQGLCDYCSGRCEGCVNGKCYQSFCSKITHTRMRNYEKRIMSEDSNNEEIRKIKRISKLLHMARQMNENA